MQSFELELIEKVNVTPHIRQLAFRRRDGQPLDFVAGQFVNFFFERGDARSQRSYSIASAPHSHDRIEIAMSPVEGGLATSVFESMQPGDVLPAAGPFGRFVLRDEEPCRYVLVATGTGVTPYRSMLSELVRRVDEEAFHIEMLLGVWRREELLYAEDFLTAAEGRERFNFTACYSREAPPGDRHWEAEGYVQHRFPHLELNPERDVIYLCGNPGMVDASVEHLTEVGFNIRQLRREKYLPSRT